MAELFWPADQQWYIVEIMDVTMYLEAEVRT
jgi:hypothetical protein